MYYNGCCNRYVAPTTYGEPCGFPATQLFPSPLAFERCWSNCCMPGLHKLIQSYLPKHLLRKEPKNSSCPGEFSVYLKHRCQFDSHTHTKKKIERKVFSTLKSYNVPKQDRAEKQKPSLPFSTF